MSISEVYNFKEGLENMPTSMRTFSLCMRSLYSDDTIDVSTNTGKKFKNLRDNTRQDAIVYLKCILPLSAKFVSSIKEYFKCFETSTFEEWRGKLSDILQKTRTYKEVAEMLLVMHEDILKNMKVRQDEAKVIMAEYKDLQRAFEREKAKYKEQASVKTVFAIGLAFVPFVNLIASPLLAVSAVNDQGKAVESHSQSKVNEAAALVVAESLIPALNSFIDGLTHAAGFFSIVERELEGFKGKAGRGSQARPLHKIMKKQAREIMSLCEKFNEILPDIRNDFEKIPDEGADQYYVDRWLDKHLVEIKGKGRNVCNFVVYAIKGEPHYTCNIL